MEAMKFRCTRFILFRWRPVVREFCFRTCEDWGSSKMLIEQKRKYQHQMNQPIWYVLSMSLKLISSSLLPKIFYINTPKRYSTSTFQNFRKTFPDSFFIMPEKIQKMTSIQRRSDELPKKLDWSGRSPGEIEEF